MSIHSWSATTQQTSFTNFSPTLSFDNDDDANDDDDDDDDDDDNNDDDKTTKGSVFVVSVFCLEEKTFNLPL